MKRALFLCSITILLVFQTSALRAEIFKSTVKHLSILGDKKNVDNYLVNRSTAAPPATVEVSTLTAGSYNVMIPTVTEQGKAGDELIKYLTEKNVFCFTNDQWLCMRRQKEGYATGNEKEVVVSTITRRASLPLPPGLSIELPYESQLSISGRKLIGVAFKAQSYDVENPPIRTNPSPSFDMTQELQVRIKGQVGRKINVNVDFDDTTADKRDISVVYKGDPGEVVQEAAFGDITMALPQTEFVGYSKQLFGVEVKTKYKGLSSWGFFSRTKGFSEVKRFTGNTQLVRKEIPDTGYIPMKYYAVRFDNDAIVNGTMQVYLDDRNQTNNNVNTSTMTVETLTSPATFYTGNFDLLIPGQDYTVDYERGIIYFRKNIIANYVMAIDYQKTNGARVTRLSSLGTPGLSKIIKFDDTFLQGFSTELKTFYSMGNLKIVRDNGRGNFILRIVDLADKTPPVILPESKPVPQYPNNITVDFENGVFNFEPPTGQPFQNSLYTQNTHAYNILTEYSYRIKFVSLRPGIVPQSEKLTMDGRLLKANEDYYIDYDAGLVTFFNEDRITESTVIEVSYDYAPFGGTGGSTLVGLRSELSLTRNVFVGTSYIYQMDAQAATVPDIRTAPTSLAVWEADSRITDIKIPMTPLRVSVGAEFAQSNRNPNITSNGAAIVESMEGIKQEDGISTNYQVWQPASNPAGERYYAGDISWSTEQVALSDINKTLVSQNNDTRQVLRVNYNLSRSTEVSIVQPFSNVGLDFSQKIYLEMWIYGDGNNEELSIGYGQFNENADGDPAATVPKTEDLNHDGTLNQGEDVGWSFLNPDGTSAPIGAGNGRIDSEDLDGNGILNHFDQVAFPGPYGAESTRGIFDTSGQQHTSVDWKGWKFFTVPLNIQNPEDWRTIKQVRLTIRKTNSTVSLAGTNNVIKLYTLSAVSNRWVLADSLVTGSTLSITALNRESDEYANESLVFNNTYKNLYSITSNDDIIGRNEQTLSLHYATVNSTGEQVAAKEVFVTAYDLSNYREFHVFVYGSEKNQGDTFFLQAGNDTDYYEYSIPITWSKWRELIIYQYDIDGKDNRPETWAVNSTGSTRGADGSRTMVNGSPTFINISQFKTGIRTSVPRSNGEVWVDEMFVANPYVKTGAAKKMNIDFRLPGWTEFGAYRKQVDRNFETFSAGVYNRDSLDERAYLKFSKLSILPINTELDHSVNVTPSVVQTQNNLVSLLEEGKVVNYNGTINSSLNIGSAFPKIGRFLPVISGQYNRAITDSQQIQQLEDRQTTSGNLEYTMPVRFVFFPTNISANYSVSNSFFRVYPSSVIPDTQDFLDPHAFYKYLGLSSEPGYKIDNYHTLDTSRAWGFKTPFQFFSWLNITPNYAVTDVREKNRDFVPELEFKKNTSQNVGINSSLRLAKWFQPNLNYMINIKETYDATSATSTVAGSTTTAAVNSIFPGQTKFIERSGTGEVAWNFQVKDIFNYKYTQSLGFSSSFRIQDSDSYNNVVSSFDPYGLYRERLWIRGNNLSDEIARFSPSSFTVQSLDYKDDARVSGRYNPFEAFNIYGRLAPVKTITTNFTFTDSKEDSTITGTRRFTTTTVWPDILLGMSQLEKMLWVERWVGESQLNLKSQIKTTKTEGYTEGNSATYGGDLRFNLLKKLDMSFSAATAWNEDKDLVANVMTDAGRNNSWSGQGAFNLKLWRFTLRYDDSLNTVTDGTGKLTTDLLTDTYTLQIYSDMSFPKGLPIPFSNKKINLTNRFIFNTTAKFIAKSSSLNVAVDNTNTASLNTSAEYEVSQNFRLSFGLGVTRMDNRVAKGVDNNSFTSYEASSRLTITF